MAQKNFQEILQGLKKEPVAVDYDTIPDELGPMREALYPGDYRFQFPASVEDCFAEPLEVALRDAEGKVIPDPKGGVDPKTNQPKILTKQRIQLIFERDHSLTIVQSPKGQYDGEAFPWRVSNVERPRFAGKGIKVQVSDLTYVLRALAPTARPVSNAEFVQACVDTLGGAVFGAAVEWSGFCNPEKEALFPFEGEKGETIYEGATLEGQDVPAKGCGTRVYMNKWPRDPKVPGKYAERAICEKCGAAIRPFASLLRFRA